MNEMPSSEFRKQYATLQEQTMVTVNGHLIGVWTPAFAYANGKVLLADGPLQARPDLARSAQAQRDDLLRKINRGK